MTVRELKEMLELFDGNLIVQVRLPGNGLEGVEHISLDPFGESDVVILYPADVAPDYRESREETRYGVRKPDGTWLADRTSAVFDGIPYRWTRHTEKAKNMTAIEAHQILITLIRECLDGGAELAVMGADRVQEDVAR